MQTEKRTDGWWIVGVPDTITECGPYDTKSEAESDKRGLQRFFKYEVNRPVTRSRGKR